MDLQNFFNIHRKHIVLIVVIVSLAFGNVFFAASYYLKVQETQKLQKQLVVQQTNKKVASFLNLFVTKVLKSDKEISFEDRLTLENAIRDINDPELLAKWEEFTGGTTEAQIQEAVKNLLQALANKIY